jgi:GntR family transcriptional regulator / MocR family aminotransferase
LERVSVEPPVLLDRAGGVSLTAQLSGQLRDAVLDGRIGAGDRLPSTRALAVSLGVSRTVVTDAYAQLYAEGWLQGRHGSGTFVAAGAAAVHGAAAGRPGAAGAPGARGARSARSAPSAPSARSARGARPAAGETGAGAARCAAAAGDVPVIDLLPGVPWTGGIDRAAWRRVWRLAGLAEPTASPMPVSDPAGLPELRRVLAGYLRRSRGMSCSAADIMVTSGVSASLDLIAAALLRPGDAAGVEEPGWPAAGAILAARGARVVPCRVDEHGLVVEALPPGLRLIHTTPAHQTPLGGRLPVPRRQALLAWARRTGALIVEDDYDSEFRYDVAPLPALHSLDPAVVAYLGTTAKTLTPELGVGWLVAPAEVLGAVAETRLSLANRTPAAVQHATLGLIECGYLERHIRRMRHEYARRRSAITGVLGGLPRPARLLGDTAGIHVMLELPAAAAGAAAAAARGRGIAVATLDRYFSGRTVPWRHGLVLGYGGATLPEVTAGCEALREIIGPLLGAAGAAGAAGPAQPAVVSASLSSGW